MSEIKFWRAILAVLSVTLSLVFIGIVWRILLPFIIGIVIAYLVNPVVDRFVAMGMKRNRVVLVLYLILLGSGVILAASLIPPLIHEAKLAVKEVPAYANALDGLIANVNDEIQHVLSPFLKAKAKYFTIPFAAQKFLDTLVLQLPQNILNYAHFGLWILVVPFMSFFALSQGREWINMIFDLTPSQYVEGLLGVFAELNATLGGYVRGVIIESLCIGLLTIVGLLMMGVNGAVLIGVITGLVNFVPFMAPLIGGGLALLTAYFQFKSLSVLLGICFLFIALRVFDDFVLIPFVVGSSVSLHPVIVVFAVLAGVEVGGFLGLVFALPIAVVLKVFFSLAMRSRKEQLMFRHHHVFS